jgi:hypothetical protein
MSIEHIRGLCHAHMNRPVEVRMLDGTIHRGIVSRVEGEHLWLSPLGDRGPGGWDGPGMYWWGFGWGFPIALAGIVGITAIALAGLWW